MKLAKIKNQKGVLLVVYIIGLVISSMVITTAFYDLVRIETDRRATRTLQKIYEVRRQVGIAESGGAGGFEVMNEAGAPMTYINENNGFPADMATFVGDGYMKNYGMTSASYQPEDDAYGTAIFLDLPIATVFQTRSFGPTLTDDGGGGDDIEVADVFTTAYQSTYTILIQDEDASHELSQTCFLNTDIVRIGTTTVVAALSHIGGAETGLYQGTVYAGQYEIRITEDDGGDYPNWITNVMGANEVRIPIWVHPENSNANSKEIRFPVDFTQAGPI